MPKWCQRNVVNWVRLLGPSWTVRVLDSVPNSPNNALRWVAADLLPEAFLQGTMDGAHSGQHSADLLRGPAVWLYGGVWMDVSVILVRDLDRMCWDKLADEGSPYRVCFPGLGLRDSANFFVAARKGDELIKKW
jgi:hypothetical protein